MKKGIFTLSFDHINQLLFEKNWPAIALLIEAEIQRAENLDEAALIEVYEKMDSDFRQEYCFNINSKLWKSALKIGKIKLAKKYAQSAIDHLVKLKRVPYLLMFIAELKSNGFRKLNFHDVVVEIIQGRCTSSKLDVNEHWEFLSLHPEKWRENKNFLKQYLVGQDHFSNEDWKLAYEYILNFHYDEDLFLKLNKCVQEMNKDKFLERFATFLRSKKVKIENLKTDKTSTTILSNSLKVNYDELALDVISGELTPNNEEQRKVLIGLRELTDDELLAKGPDMIVAFSLLGMDEVVKNLGDRMIPLLTDVRARASVQYTCAQALYEKQNFYTVLDYIDDVLEKEPLLETELMAFEYLKAEALLKLKRAKQAHALFTKINKRNPSYRLVLQRLKDSEVI